MKTHSLFLEYLLLFSPTIIHLIVDYKGKVIHWLNAIYVSSFSLCVGFFLAGYFWQGAFYALTIHFCFFDWMYNFIHGHVWNYHGSINNPSRSLTDKIWSKYFPPTAEIFIRIWVLLVGIGVYYHLDWII
jgi:hypothetical protein